MAKYNYTIAGDYSSPASNETKSDNFNAEISEETAMNFLLMMRSIIDEQLEKRIKEGQDIAKVYTAEITKYSITESVITSITVKYNDEDYIDINNDSVKILPAEDIDRNKWIKICTYDGVNFYVLHKM